MEQESSKTKRVTGECKLCGCFGELEAGHIIPAFVFRYIRETGLIQGGGLRFAEQPNKVVQDGDKRHWFCRACEGKFSKDEQKFYEKIFKPTNEGHQPQLDYGPELLRFCVSLSWRTLLRYQEIEHDETELRPISQLDEKDQELITKAEMEWKDYLNGNGRSSEKFVQHIAIMGKIDSLPLNMSVGINKYIQRAPHQDILSGKTGVVIYTKIPGIFIFGIIRDEETWLWNRTQVLSSGGTLPGNEAVRLPDWFYAYLNEQAEQYQGMSKLLSERQRERTDQKVHKEVESDPERLRKSPMFEAIEADERLAQNQGYSTLIDEEAEETMESGHKPIPDSLARFDERVTPETQSKIAAQLREIARQAGFKGHIGEQAGSGKYFTTGLIVESEGEQEEIEVRGLPLRQNPFGHVLVSFVGLCDYTGYTDEEMQDIRSRLLEENYTATFARYARLKNPGEETIVAVADAVADTLQPLEMFRLVFHVGRLAIERPRRKAR
ncbi:MAG: hypothetical protein OXF97_10800 [Nitrospira sp.]|nr:hypothetical protein [Nitrospira sp.]